MLNFTLKFQTQSLPYPKNPDILKNFKFLNFKLIVCHDFKFQLNFRVDSRSTTFEIVKDPSGLMTKEIINYFTHVQCYRCVSYYPLEIFPLQCGYSYTVHSRGTCMYQLWHMDVFVKLHLSCTILARVRTTIQLCT